MPHRPYVFKSTWKRAAARVFDALGDLLVAPWVKRRTLEGPSRRLLILRLDHLGDVIATLPLLEALAQLKPKPYFAVAVSPSSAILLRDTPGVDMIKTFQA